jgi:hypothetical protein
VLTRFSRSLKLRISKRAKKVKDVGSQATPEVIQTWNEVQELFQSFKGERRERLQQVADRLGVSYKVARRRLRNYEAMGKGNPEANIGDGDQNFKCIECKEVFTWSASEQAFFHEKGFTDPPKRCKVCRQARKESRGPGQQAKGQR